MSHANPSIGVGQAATPFNGLLVVVCTFNERDNLPRLVEALRRHVPGGQVLVVDDQSPDGTGQWAAGEAARSADIHCLLRENERGLGSAALAGLRWGLDRRYRLLATLDADFSHDPADLAQLVNLLEEDKEDATGLVIGSRYCPGGRISGWPAARRWASRGLNLLSRVVLGLRVADCTGAFRVYRATALNRIDLKSIRSHGFGYLEELLHALVRVGVQVVECPIHFRDRHAGQSKATFREAFSAAANIFRIRFARPKSGSAMTRSPAPPVVSSPRKKSG